jgi:hypothetical protein
MKREVRYRTSLLFVLSIVLGAGTIFPAPCIFKVLPPQNIPLL